MLNILLVLSVLLPFTVWAQDPINNQKIISLKSEKSKMGVLKYLEGRDVVVVATGKAFLVLRPKSEEKKFYQLLGELRMRKEVLSIEGDKKVFPLSDTVCNIGICEDRTLALPQLDDQSKLILDISNSANGDNGDCRLSPKCRNNSNPYWASMQMGADLADEIVTALMGAFSEDERSSKASTVAVVDSGFDKVNHGPSIKALSLVIERGHESAGDPEIDPDGHGTAVSGMISGEGTGITKNVNLRIYRVTEKHGNGSTTSGLLAAAIERACEHSDIVNVSWGGIADDLGHTRLEKELWYKQAVAKGCLVIKSAGNGGVKKNHHFNLPLDAPYLSVAASDFFNEETTFSTKGMVMGPGQGVYSLLSKQHEYGPNTEASSCLLNGKKIGPINGTSFSSPAVAAVAGQVLTVLRLKGLIPTDPKEKIKLLKSILFASAHWNKQTGGEGGSINALAAVLVAQGLTSSNLTHDLDKLVAIGMGASQEKCLSPSNNCLDPALLCTDKIKCVHDLRFKVLVCVPPQEDHLERAFNVLQSLHEIELTTLLIKRSPKNSKISQQAAQALEDLWKQNIKSSSIIDTALALNILDSARQKGLKSVLQLEKFRLLFSSFGGTFRINEKLGENVWNGGKESLFPKLLLSFKELSPAHQMALIAEIPNIAKHSQDTQLGVLYLLHDQLELFQDSVQVAIKNRVKQLAESWYSGRLDVQGSLSYKSNGPVFDLFSTQIPKERLKTVIARPFSPQYLHIFSHAFHSEVLLDPVEKVELARKIFQQHATSPLTEQHFFLESVVEAWIASGDSKADNVQLKEFLLANGMIELPQEAVTKNSKRTSILAEDKDFWRTYIKLTLGRAFQVMAEEVPPDWVFARLPSANLEVALFKNNLLSKAEKLQIYQENKAAIIGLLRETSKTIVKYKKTRNHLTAPAWKVISLFMDSDWSPGLPELPEIKDALTVLQKDVQSTPQDYSQDKRRALARFFGLDE